MTYTCLTWIHHPEGNGVLYGGWVAVLPAVVDYFGGRNVSGIIGILYTSVAFGTLIGPRAAGFASAAANIVAALIVTIMIRPAPVHDRS